MCVIEETPWLDLSGGPVDDGSQWEDPIGEGWDH